MWRFVQVTDTHIGATRDGQRNNLIISSMMPDVIRCLAKDLQSITPDFILATGDISAETSRDAMFAARDLLDSLGIAYYPVGGDADFAREKGREWFVDAFHARLPIRDTVYSFTHKGLHFVILDPWWRWPDGTLCPSLDGLKGDYSWQLPPHQLEWLENDLNRFSHLPTILAMHCPAIEPPKRFKTLRFPDKAVLENRDLLMEVVRRHRQVRVLFSGHAHMNYIVSERNLVHIVTASLSEFPIEYRVVDVFNDHLSISTRGLTNETFAKSSLLSQETPKGEEADRIIDIPLMF
ncbi:MAG TPA: metallophosphoesterase [Candidatus Hydrogenedentes bacterium]|nr:metallophosphoesterase [Candidatus Hydrogenedentota bacterium]HOL77564.1 metallophosphoesterase [Candidatus Hydrogenedentota bacterium]HPO84869.1 metallophosphoesterase [Candidatus Hydrogenedentota bacterium]